MGTGVGEAALAAEAFGAAEAAGAVAGGAGFLEGMAGASALEGAGVAGLGLGTGAGLSTGAGLAGGLGSLSPAFQTALGETAVFNPDIAAQTAQFANIGAVPNASAALGAGQIGDPALAQLTQALQNPTTSSQMAALYGPGTQVAAAPGVGADSVMGDVLRQSSRGLYDLGATDMSLGAAGEANAAAAAAPSVTQAAGAAFDPSTMATINQGAGDLATKTSFGSLNPLTSAYNLWKEQDPLTKGVTGGLGALQVAKYLSKPQGVAAPEKYSGPLSKFSYSPDTYKPYVYKPYAEGGNVEAKEAAPTTAPGVAQATPVVNAGLPALSAAAQALPEVAASRQNFVDFLSHYQNMPVAPTTAPVVAPNVTATPLQPGPNAAYYPAGSRYASMANDQLADAARKVSFEQKPGYLRELELIQGNNVAPVSDPYGYANWQRGYDIGMAAGGTVEQMSRENALGANTGYPQADINQGAYATPWQTPVSRNVVTGPSDANVDQMTGEERMAGGGIASLGGYSDGGRLLKGPGDGMSDNIPANIGGRQPARLADGEFVVPADVVSGLGNGSTEAGAKQLYKMLDKVRSARTGTKKQGKQINPNKYTPA